MNGCNDGRSVVAAYFFDMAPSSFRYSLPIICCDDSYLTDMHNV